MSDHDPFDGIYDDGQAGASNVATSPAQQATVVPAESAPPASEVSAPESHSRSQLERMKKAELQVAARERSLVTTGDRDDLIERIVADQSR